MTKQQQLTKLYNEMNEKWPDRKMVFGDGNADARILFIGEAPGGDEIKQMKPFVGKAGKNLDSFFETLGLDRTKLYITNTVKFRPTKESAKGNTVNRTPNTKEIDEYKQFLFEEIALVDPAIVITLGSIALKAINNDEASITNLHGELVENNTIGIKTFALYHPAAIIYNQELKPIYDADIEKLKEILKDI